MSTLISLATLGYIVARDAIKEYERHNPRLYPQAPMQPGVPTPQMMNGQPTMPEQMYQQPFYTPQPVYYQPQPQVAPLNEEKIIDDIMKKIEARLAANEQVAKVEEPKVEVPKVDEISELVKNIKMPEVSHEEVVLPETKTTDNKREYRIKIYLNAKHYIYNNGIQGETHPHTWEFALTIYFPNHTFVEFNKIEDVLNKFLELYQNKCVNDREPFDHLIPTVENMAEYFSAEMSKLIADLGGELNQLICSETPTRSYIVNVESLNIVKEKKEEEVKAKKDLIAERLDLIMQEMNK